LGEGGFADEIAPAESEELKLLKDIREQLAVLAAASQAADAAAVEKAGPTRQLDVTQGNPRTARAYRRFRPP
jgi:hypothetical protein